MKATILAAALAAAMTTAQAVTVTPLATPANVPSAYPAKVICIGTSFNVDDSINGYCHSQTASGSSGRGGHPTYTNLVYAATWDAEGVALSATYCGTNKVNLGFVNTWTYASKYSAATCQEPTAGSTQVSLYDPAYGFDVWFFYQGASVDGLYELVSLGTEGMVYGL